MASSTTAEQLCRRFTLAEIQSATGDFSEEHVIGKGGFGKVYKGFIDDGSISVAIKRLASNSNQGETEFATEMETLTQLRHRNLVSLIGYCKEVEEMILVYEFMPNGTLADHLHKLADLTWKQRLAICIGAGRGLDYLHTGNSIIHRDVKSTNILLDENFEAKVSDFGLAKHLANNFMSHVFASIKGTFGYIDPSYFTTGGRLTRASDTYAFGVMMLEVLTGRQAVDPKLGEREMCLTWWAKEKIENGKADQIVASNLRGDISEDCLKTFINVAKICLDHEPTKRLTMSRVVAQLELAFEQQERKGSSTRKLQFWPFWNRVPPSGSTQKDHTHVEVNMLPNAISEIPVDELENKQDVDYMLPNTISEFPVDELDNKQNVDHMLPNAISEIPVVELENKQDVDNMLPNAISEIPIAEIEEITCSFSSKCLINMNGGGGRLYHGVLKSGRDAAIKPIYVPNKEYLQEVSIVSSLKHEHVTELLGYSMDGSSQFMAYEFAARGSLYDILHGTNGVERGSTLSWAQRIKIAVGAAKGLHYIHEKKLIHGSIRSSNVLIFHDEIAKITDFHLSIKCGCKEKELLRLRVDIRHPSAPPFRHLHHQPECHKTGKSEKGDVYGFGVILLQLLTGRKWKVVDLVSSLSLSWAKPMLSEACVETIVDARLKGDYPLKAVAKMVAVAQLCIQREYKSRPDMGTVLRHLQIASEETKYYLQKLN